MRGRAQLKAKDFIAKADHVEIGPDDDDKAAQALLLKLEGNAALKYTGKCWLPASRIELRLSRGDLRADQPKFK